MKRAFALLIAAAIGGCGQASQRPGHDDGQTFDVVSLHWPVAQPRPDARMCELRATGEQIALDPEPVLGTRDIVRAYMDGPGEDVLTLELTADGRAELARVTAGRIGERLAIVIDDVVVAMPSITSPLNIPAIPLPPHPHPGEARQIMQKINAAIAASDRESDKDE